jgi:diguanylate cyclase (GGDEF)-like protein/PAS domain S-box-containing protein
MGGLALGKGHSGERWRRLGLAVALCGLGALLGAPFAAEGAPALEPVTLQLKWLHQFQFAGYYAAEAQGYYRAAGLEVRFREAVPGMDVVDQVLSGGAQYGVGTSELLLRRYHGAQVVVLGVIFQHSPLAIAARSGAGIANVHDLSGKRVMIEPDSAELFAYLRREGIEHHDLALLPHGFDLRDFIEGRADALSVYITDEVFELDRRGIAYGLFRPTSAGIDFYGENLFTSEEELRLHPARVRAFREASFKGWIYAMTHREEIAQLIHAQYSQRHSVAHLLFEAQRMAGLLHCELIAPGYMHEGRWRHIAETYAEFGMLPPLQADNLFHAAPFAGFLYDPAPPYDLERLRGWLAAGLGLIAIFGILGFYIQRLNRRLARSEQRYRVIYQTAPTALVLLDRHSRVSGWNRAAEEIFGWSEEEARGLSLFEFLVPKDQQEQVRKVVDHAMASRAGGALTWNLTKYGRRILCEWRSAPLLDHRGRVAGVVGLATDVTERQRLEERLEFRAHYDALTGLPNRLLLSDRLEQAVAFARRSQGGFGLFFIDLDGFKAVNDHFGHQAGDQTLRLAAQRFKAVLRDSDTLARLGGDEFVALLHGVERYEDAAVLAGKLIGSLAAPFDLEGQGVMLGASVGIALYPADTEDPQALLNAADNAMYEAKRCGKNTYRWNGGAPG